MEPNSLQQPELLWVSFVGGVNSLFQLQNLPKGQERARQEVLDGLCCHHSRHERPKEER